MSRTGIRADRARETTERLLAVAQAAFAGRGFADVSLDDLAAEAGVTRGALHHHFTNKAGLFAAVLRRIDAEIGAEMEAVWQSRSDPLAALAACFHHYLDTVQHPARRRILFQDALAVMGLEAAEILMNSGLAGTIDCLQGLAAAGRLRLPDPEAAAHVLNATSLELAFWASEDPGTENRLARAHQALAQVFDGIAINTAH
jgi:AcrR family transcriptional regulator